MIQKLKNINSVAFYEAKLLGRGWFFRIFALLLIALGSTIILTHDDNRIFSNSQLDGLFAYFICSCLNVAQSIIIIFLSADYLKSDKQLDTSEVFYVRPLSNAEYLLGKMSGTVMKFVKLDLLLLVIFFLLGKYAADLNCSPLDFLLYFGIIIVPSLIFIVGISTTVMLLIGNQAITFVVMLGVSMLSLLYVGDFYYNLFDMFGFNIPMYGSGEIGFSNFDQILSHRLIYLSFGVSSIFLSIFMFKRLAGSSSARYKWLVFSLVLYGYSFYSGYQYYRAATITEREREVMMSLNNQYASYPRLLVANYDIDVEHLGGQISSYVAAKGVMSQEGSSVVFTLNSGMKLDSVSLVENGVKPLDFERKKHLIVVDLGREYAEGDSLALGFKYQGSITESELFIDVDSKEKQEAKNSTYQGVVKIDKKGAIIDPEWVVLTPESYWYPLSGVSYTDSVASWSVPYFSKYSVRVKPQKGMVPVVQGRMELLADSLTYQFRGDKPYRAVSLAISDYKHLTDTVDNVEYSVYIHKNNLSVIEPLSLIADTMPSLLKAMRTDIERNAKTKYELDKFAIVDTPAELYSYKRTWNTTQELMQPELMFVPGAGFREWSFGFKDRLKWMKYAIERGWYWGAQKNMSDTMIVASVFSDVKWLFYEREQINDISSGKMGQYSVKMRSNPYFFASVAFNSLYNIYSDNYSWGNSLIEQYVYPANNNTFTRQLNGLSDFEQTMLLFKEYRPDDIITNPKYAQLYNVIVEALGNGIFAESMSKLGVDEFKKMLKEVIESNKFSNISFESLIDTISAKSEIDIRSKIEKTKSKIDLSSIYTLSPVKCQFKGATKNTFVSSVKLQNGSNVEAYVHLTFYGNPLREMVVKLDPLQAKEVVVHSPSEYYSLEINSMNSLNLPQIIYGRFVDGIVPEKLPEEGERVVDAESMYDPNEIIVDNEDAELFSINEPKISGYLNLWVEKSMENDFKYKGESFRAPSKWTLVSSDRYHGDYIKSAYRVRKGEGDRTATWRIPIKESGRYSLYVAVRYPYELRWLKRNGRKANSCYDFTIKNGDKTEQVLVDLANLSQRDFYATWLWIGDVNVAGDELALTLSNKTDLSEVIADAVKAVKID